MDPADDDHDLKAAFAKLRGSDQQAAPDFGALLERSLPDVSGTSRTRPWLIAAAVGAFALAVYSTPQRLVPDTPAPVVPWAQASITSWTPATDFLLETPASELLWSMPSFGADAVPPLLPTPPDTPIERRTNR